MSARVAVFGVSRSGKDYTIRDASNLLAEKGMMFSHVSPIRMVHDELDGRKLSDMPEKEKHEMVTNVRNRMGRILRDDYVFVDEHFCFPETFNGVRVGNGYHDEKLPYRIERGIEGRNYETVFESDWLKGYDMVVYMDIDPCVIIDRFRSSEGVKRNIHATYDDIRLWQMFEIDGIGELCRARGIPLYYIYDHEKSGEELATVVRHHLRSRNSGTRIKTENHMEG